MKASAENIKIGDTVIFKCDEYRNGKSKDFDGTVLAIDESGCDIVYLSGCMSRNDRVLWVNIVAKLDKRKDYIKLDSAPYRGCFLEFNKN